MSACCNVDKLGRLDVRKRTFYRCINIDCYAGPLLCRQHKLIVALLPRTSKQHSRCASSPHSTYSICGTTASLCSVTRSPHVLRCRFLLQDSALFAHHSYLLDPRWSNGFQLHQSIPGEKHGAVIASNAGVTEAQLLLPLPKG